MESFKKYLPLVFLMLILSCSEQEETTLSKDDNSKEVLSYILQLGFSEADIVDTENAYIVEGDIAFPKDMIVPEIEQSKSSDNGRVQQYYYGTLLTSANQHNIRVKADPNMSSQANETNSALALWNVASSNIRFILVTTGAYDILIQDAYLGASGCGQAGFPSGGLPFGNVSISIANVASDSYAQRTINIAHELGHCIGFWHTNSTGGTAVPNWGGSDGLSIMNGGICHSLPEVLSPKDRGALYKLYGGSAPDNLAIGITCCQFQVTWTPISIVSDPSLLTGFDVSYGGFSGINFGGTASLPASASTFTVPGAVPYPTSGSTTTGGIQVTVTAKYSYGINASKTVTRNKVNGVWQ